MVDLLPSHVPIREQLVLGLGGHQQFNLAPTPYVVFNGISDPDTHRAALLRADALCSELGEFATAVLNSPQRVLATTRDQISQSFQQTPGVRTPACVRIQPRSPNQVLGQSACHSVSAPLLIREAGKHGSEVILLQDETDLDALHALPLDGRDYYATSFVDYRDDDGYFRKYRVLVVDGRPYLRHMLASSSWKIYSATRKEMVANAELVREERELMENYSQDLAPRLQSKIEAIHQHLGLDYFAIDFAILPGDELLLFEANANVNPLIRNYPDWPNTTQYDAAIGEMVDAIATMMTRYGAG